MDRPCLKEIRLTTALVTHPFLSQRVFRSDFLRLSRIYSFGRRQIALRSQEGSRHAATTVLVGQL